MLACHKQVGACRCLVCLSPFNLSDLLKDSALKSRTLKHRAMAGAVSAARERLRQVSLISTEFSCPKLQPRAGCGIPELYRQRAWGLCTPCPQLCGRIWASKSVLGTIPADTNLVYCPLSFVHFQGPYLFSFILGITWKPLCWWTLPATLKGMVVVDEVWLHVGPIPRTGFAHLLSTCTCTVRNSLGDKALWILVWKWY